MTPSMMKRKSAHLSGLPLAISAAFMMATPAMADVCSPNVVRAAFDVGSATTKIKVALIDTCTKKIREVLYEGKEKVGYRADLAAGDEFSQAIEDQGVQVFAKLKADAIAALKAKKKPLPDMFVGVATEAFRRSKNADEFVKRIYNETQVKVVILKDQQKEALLEITGVAARKEFDLNKIVVWGIGGGSMQIETLGKNKKYAFYLGSVASDEFAAKVNGEVKGITDLETAHQVSPNPIASSKEEYDTAVKVAQDLAQSMVDFSENPAVLKEKLADPNTIVIGVGGVLNDGVKNYVAPKDRFFTSSEVKDQLDSWISMSDSELPGDSKFKKTMASNLVMVYGFMKQLKISQVVTSDVNLTDGLFFMATFLNEGNQILARQVAANPNYQACVELAGSARSMTFTPNGSKDVCYVRECISTEVCEVSGYRVLGQTKVCAGPRGDMYVNWPLCKN